MATDPLIDGSFVPSFVSKYSEHISSHLAKLQPLSLDRVILEVSLLLNKDIMLPIAPARKTDIKKAVLTQPADRIHQLTTIYDINTVFTEPFSPPLANSMYSEELKRILRRINPRTNLSKLDSAFNPKSQSSPLARRLGLIPIYEDRLNLTDRLQATLLMSTLRLSSFFVIPSHVNAHMIGRSIFLLGILGYYLLPGKRIIDFDFPERNVPVNSGIQPPNMRGSSRQTESKRTQFCFDKALPPAHPFEGTQLLSPNPDSIMLDGNYQRICANHATSCLSTAKFLVPNQNRQFTRSELKLVKLVQPTLFYCLEQHRQTLPLRTNTEKSLSWANRQQLIREVNNIQPSRDPRNVYNAIIKLGKLIDNFDIPADSKLKIKQKLNIVDYTHRCHDSFTNSLRRETRTLDIYRPSKGPSSLTEQYGL